MSTALLVFIGPDFPADQGSDATFAAGGRQPAIERGPNATCAGGVACIANMPRNSGMLPGYARDTCRAWSSG